MPGSLSNYAEDQVLSWITGNTALSQYSNIYPMLFIQGSNASVVVSGLPVDIGSGSTPTGTPTAVSTSATASQGGLISTSFTVTTRNAGDTANQAMLVPTFWDKSYSSSNTYVQYSYNKDITFEYTGAGSVFAEGVGLFTGNTTSGLLLAWTEFLSSKQLSNGEKLVIPAGTLKLQLS